MNAGWFTKPVPIAVGIAGGIRHIESAKEAAALLADNWRCQGTAKPKAATRACLSAMHGDSTSELARSAFVDAADEARILAD